jgi:hypothetical protein
MDRVRSQFPGKKGEEVNLKKEGKKFFSWVQIFFSELHFPVDDFQLSTLPLQC